VARTGLADPPDGRGHFRGRKAVPIGQALDGKRPLAVLVNRPILTHQGCQHRIIGMEPQLDMVEQLNPVHDRAV
jgi:hypothetical protein